MTLSLSLSLFSDGHITCKELPSLTKRKGTLSAVNLFDRIGWVEDRADVDFDRRVFRARDQSSGGLGMEGHLAFHILTVSIAV